MRRTRPYLPRLSCLLCASSFALAQASLHLQAAAQTSSAAIPVLRAQARQVIVDVVVLDKNGVPVHGLKQSDFALTEEGAPQTLKGFEEHASTGENQAAFSLCPTFRRESFLTSPRPRWPVR